MLLKLPIRQLDNVVVGGDIGALLYSHKHNSPIIINHIFKPHRFEKDHDKSLLKLWHKLYYSLSLSGLNLLGNKVQYVRIKDEEISVTTKDARVIKFGYNKAIIFDDENVSGLPPIMKRNKDFIVLDWIVTESCQMHEHNYFKTEDNFVNEVYFYPSERIDGHHPNRKDLVAFSFLTEEQLEDFGYSDTYAKFKVIKMMKEAGIGGRKCGGNNQYALKIEVNKREIRKVRMHTYKNTDKMEFK